MTPPLLSVKLKAGYGKNIVLRDVEFDLHAGERLGLIGSSGAGKSTVLMALLGLLPWRNGWAEGEVLVDGKNLLRLPERDARKLRGKMIALVPQSPLTALNSALTLRTHFLEAWKAHGEAARTLDSRVMLLFGRVNLPTEPTFLKRRPNELSVGQAQRVTIALALLHRPRIIIADEPTSSLDPVNQKEIIDLLRELSEEQGTALLYISHDLLSVLQLADNVALLHDGQIAERLSVDGIEGAARHPALRALLQTLPVPADILLNYAKLRAADTICSLLSTLPSSPELYNLGAMVCETISK